MAASPLDQSALRRAIDAATRGAARLPARRRPLGVRAGGRCDHPRRIRAVEALSRRAGRPGPGAKDRRLSASPPGRAWRLAAVPQRRFRHERQRESLFRAQDDRRRRRRAAHARARARRSWRMAARSMSTCSPAACCRSIGMLPLAQRAGDAGRDHAAAALVSFHLVEDLVLGAHRARAAAGAAGAQAARQQSARRSASTSCSSKAAATVGPPRQGAASERGSGSRCSAPSTWCCAPPSRAFPRATRRRAIARAVAFVTERLNGEDGLGAIFPAMANSRDDVRALGVSGGPPGPRHRAGLDRQAAGRRRRAKAYCQPCVSPVWDTALACHALLEAGEPALGRERAARLEWLLPRQVLDVKGDWALQAAGRAARRLGLPICQSALSRPRRHRGGRDGDGPRAPARGDPAIRSPRSRGRANGSKACKSGNGGWGAFDADNTHDYLNNIPFADHGALLDPPTDDVTARCVSMLAQLGETRGRRTPMRRGDRLSAPHADRRRQLVRPLGHELHLRHLVGAVRAQCCAARPRDPPEMRKRRRLADCDSKSGRRLG